VGPSAGPLLSTAVKKRRAVTIITWLGIVTVAAGWIMWIRHASEFGSIGDWVGTRFGLGITIGAVIATVTLFVGCVGVGRDVERLVDLGDEVAAAAGRPRPDSRRRWSGSERRWSGTGSSTRRC
jgi:hypothetical protein